MNGKNQKAATSDRTSQNSSGIAEPEVATGHPGPEPDAALVGEVGCVATYIAWKEAVDIDGMAMHRELVNFQWDGDFAAAEAEFKDDPSWKAAASVHGVDSLEHPRAMMHAVLIDVHLPKEVRGCLTRQQRLDLLSVPDYGTRAALARQLATENSGIPDLVQRVSDPILFADVIELGDALGVFEPDQIDAFRRFMPPFDDRDEGAHLAALGLAARVSVSLADWSVEPAFRSPDPARALRILRARARYHRHWDELARKLTGDHGYPDDRDDNVEFEDLEITNLGVGSLVKLLTIQLSCTAAGVRPADDGDWHADWQQWIDVFPADGAPQTRTTLAMIVWGLWAVAPQRISGVLPEDVFDAKAICRDHAWMDPLMSAMNAFAEEVDPGRATAPFDAKCWRLVLNEAAEIINKHSALAMLMAGMMVLLEEVDDPERRLVTPKLRGSRPRTLSEFGDRLRDAMIEAAGVGELQHLRTQVRDAEARIRDQLAAMIQNSGSKAAKKPAPIYWKRTAPSPPRKSVRKPVRKSKSKPSAK